MFNKSKSAKLVKTIRRAMKAFPERVYKDDLFSTKYKFWCKLNEEDVNIMFNPNEYILYVNNMTINLSLIQQVKLITACESAISYQKRQKKKDMENKVSSFYDEIVIS